MRSFPLLTPSLSSVLLASPSSSLYHLRAYIPFSSSPTSLIHSFHTPAYSSLCLFPPLRFTVFSRFTSLSFSFCVPAPALRSSLFFSPRVKRAFFCRSLQRLPTVIYSYTAPLNYARNYAYSDRASTSEMHPGKCISHDRGVKTQPKIAGCNHPSIRSLVFFFPS